MTMKELLAFNKAVTLLTLFFLIFSLPVTSMAGEVSAEEEIARMGTPQKPISDESGPTQMVKISYLMRRKPGMTREQFLDYWSNQHPAAGGEGSFEALGVKRYVQTHTLDLPVRKWVVNPREGLVPEFDGIAELWVERDFLETEWPTQKVQDLIAKFYADELNFVDWSRSTILLSKELVYMK